MRHLVLVPMLLASGCLHFKKVGLADKPIQVKEQVPLVCLDANLKQGGGRQATLTEGTLEGRPAIAIDGALTIGFSYAFTDELQLDGETVYVGQECLPRYDGVVCDRGLYVRRGERRYFLYWAAVEMTDDDAKQKAITDVSAQEMASRPEVQAFLAKLRKLDIDERTGKAMAALSQARHTRKTWNAVLFFSGAAMAQLGPVFAAKGITDVGEAAMKFAANPEVDESELAMIKANPKLADLFFLGGFGTVCAGPLQYAN